METGRSCRLTSREREVLVLVGRGATSQEIAERLWLSVHTVNTHVHNAMEKLEARTRAEAICRVLQEGLLR